MDNPKIVSFGQVEINPKPLEKIDPENLTILPVLNLVLFPGMTMPISLSRPESVMAAEYAEKHNLPIGVICQTDPSAPYPGTKDDLHEFGVIGQIVHIATIFEETKTAIVKALPRQKFEMEKLFSVEEPEGKFLKAKVKICRDRKANCNDKEYPVIVKELVEQAETSGRQRDDSLPGWAEGVQMMSEPADKVNFLATNSPIETGAKAFLLKLGTDKERARHLLEFLYHSNEMNNILERIRQSARQTLTEQQKRMYLQHQYDAMHDELYGDEDDDVAMLKKKAEDSGMPEFVARNFEKDLRKMERFNPQSPDYAVLQTYLDTITELPWNKKTELQADFKKAEEILEADHYGMEDVKSRILEQLAVTLHNRNVQSPIICLVGAPGVGKTSLGRSIANALGREYQRVSLGGIHDESEIRGHRRTYIGAMPGRIMAAIQKSGVNNPLLLLDEIDKLGKDIKGDPSAALLEVLDPEQNCHFHDNYIDVDFDLSDVFFVATANTLDTLPRPLLDRMEIIEMPGYLLEEKVEIARRHLIPAIRKKYMLDDVEFEVSDEAVKYIIRNYTAESGVRLLEKKLSEVARKTLLEKERGKETAMPVDVVAVRRLLGLETYLPDEEDTTTPTGVATGLAWTSVGGEILEIETSLSPSKSPKLTLTGNLGDVMKESAMLAMQYVRAHSGELGIDAERFENSEIHIHVPEGAIPKDGPSAGITITTALVSLLTGRKVRPRVAMTGEMTLRGKVLPVGGIKEKILAAKRHGITDIYLCRRNRRHIEDIKPELLEGLAFHYVDTFDDVMKALEQ